MSYAKNRGGLGFRNLYGFNIALLGKYIWNFLHNPNTLVARLFKARYFPRTNVLKSAKGHGISFIWKGIWTAKEELGNGFRWVMGDGANIIATKDQWLKKKPNFRVTQHPIYEGRTETVASLFLPGEKKWNINLVKELFL